MANAHKASPNAEQLNSSEQNVGSEAVAQWMVEEIESGKVLQQSRAARHIKNNFGEAFTYKNKNRNLAITKEVLDAFKALSRDFVVWSKRDRSWRKRRATDKPCRQQH